MALKFTKTLLNVVIVTDALGFSGNINAAKMPPDTLKANDALRKLLKSKFSSDGEHWSISENSVDPFNSIFAFKNRFKVSGSVDRVAIEYAYPDTATAKDKSSLLTRISKEVCALVKNESFTIDKIGINLVGRIDLDDDSVDAFSKLVKVKPNLGSLFKSDLLLVYRETDHELGVKFVTVDDNDNGTHNLTVTFNRHYEIKSDITPDDIFDRIQMHAESNLALANQIAAEVNE